MAGDDARKNEGVSRRMFLKATGAASAAAGVSGLGVWGYRSGKDPASYTGCEGFQGAAQRFNRARFAVDKPHYEVVGPTSRPDGRTEVIFSRVGSVRRLAREGGGVETLEEPWRSFYQSHPEAFELDKQIAELQDKIREEHKTEGDRLILAEAWAHAMSAVQPRGIGDTPPEESDFPDAGRGHPSEPLKMKDPEATARLIKKISYELGSVLTGVTKLNPDWVYRYPSRRRGFPMDEPLEVPEHWEYAIVVGTPMSWDPMYANPNFGTSQDAYSKSRIVAYRLASFIKQLGYAARPHTPGTDYDLMVPPILVDAGIGEQGRHSIVVTPELGCNFRPAVITTNLPMATDKPIRFGVQEFCQTCKICAENCPSGAITMGEKEVVRGYRRYAINDSKCFGFWNSKLGSMGCRICIAACPYTRKSNWAHRAALHATANDPTGLSHKALAGLQKRFYPGPDPQGYYAKCLGGENASYRQPPWWLRAEDFIDFSS
jgi:reductive dehalogenase